MLTTSFGYPDASHGTSKGLGCTDRDVLCRFFSARYPQLLLTVYSFGLIHCDQEPQLSSYFPDSARDFPFASPAANKRRTAPGKIDSSDSPALLQVTS